MLNHREPTPLYRQLLDRLRLQIEEKKITPDQPIPSERALCEKYRISRTTVRQAISQLINEGLLYNQQGKGTFVARNKVNQGLVRFNNFQKTVLELGMTPSTRILHQDVLPADVLIAKLLDIPATDQIFRLSLLGMGDREPLVLYESYFPLALGKVMAREAGRFVKRRVPFSTYDLYGRAGKTVPQRVDQTFEAVIADERLASVMKMKRGAPVFMITSIFQTSDHHPLEFRKAMYRGDRYKFHITRDFS